MNHNCIDCQKEISCKATRCQSCGQKKRFENPTQHNHYKDGRTLTKHYCIDCNSEIGYQALRCRKCCQKGKNHSHYIDGIKFAKDDNNCIDCGKDIDGRATRCHVCSKLGILNVNYIENLDRNYPIDFNEQLKEEVRDRDNHECQCCHKTEEQELIDLNRKLSIHHIDYDKENCNEENLISLCIRCHLKTNYNREYWKMLFKNLIEKMYCLVGKRG